MANIQIIENPKDIYVELQSINSQIQELKSQLQPKEPTTYLSRKEVAEMLQINLTTLWSWTNARKLRAYSIGNRVYYKRAEVEAMIKPLNEVE